MKNGLLEDVFPIESVEFHCYVSLPEGIYTPRKTRGLHSLKRISDLLKFSEKHIEPKAGFQPLVFLGGLHPGKKQHMLHPKS